MKNFLKVFVGLMVFSNGYAHNSVETVTTNNKLIISKDFNEVVKGDTASLYRNQASMKSGMNLRKVKISEHKMPKIGDKIKIYRTTINLSDERNKKIESIYHELIGTATVVSPELEGDSRTVNELSKNRMKNVSTKVKKYSTKELRLLKANAIVATPDNGILVKSNDSIEF